MFNLLPNQWYLQQQAILSHQLAAATKLNYDLQARITSQNAEIERLVNRNRDLESQLNCKTEMVRKFVAQHMDKNVNFNSHVNQNQDVNEMVQQQSETLLSHQVVLLTGEITVLKEDNERKMAQITELVVEKNNLKEDNEIKTSEINQLKDKLEKKEGLLIENLYHETVLLTGEITVLKEDNERKKARITELTVGNNKLKENNETKTAEINQLNAELEKKEGLVIELSQKIILLNGEITNLKDYERKMNQITELMVENNNLKEDNETKMAEVNQLKVELNKKESLLLEKETSISHLNGLINQEINEKNECIQLNKAKDRIVRKKDDIIAQLCQQKSDLQNAHYELWKKMRTYKEINEKLINEISTLLDDCNFRMSLKEMLKTSKADLFTKLSHLKMLHDQTKVECNELCQENINFVKVFQEKLHKKLKEFLFHQNKRFHSKLDLMTLKYNSLGKQVLELQEVHEHDQQLLQKQLKEENEQKNLQLGEQSVSFIDENVLKIKRTGLDKDELEYCKDQCVQKQIEVEELTNRILQLEAAIVALKCDVSFALYIQ